MAESFFAFPLSLLAMPAEDPKTRLGFIVDSAIVRAGNGFCKRIRIEQASAVATEYCEENRIVSFDAENEIHRHIATGAHICGVEISNIPEVYSGYQGCIQFSKAWTFRYNTLDPLVFVATKLFWSALNGGALPYDEFTLICAVNSVLGLAGPPKIIGRDLLIARQLGCNTPKVMAAALDDGKLPSEPLTTSQIRTRLDRLEQRGLFVRCQANKRHVYFATPPTTEEQLREYVRGANTKKVEIKQRRERDRAVLMLNEAAAKRDAAKAQPFLSGDLVATGKPLAQGYNCR